MEERMTWKTFKLEKNYRCKSKICRAAQTLIEHNPDRVQKQTIANEVGGTVVVEAFDSPAEELTFIAHELTRAHNGNGRPEDGYPARLDDLKQTAILCRTNPLANQFAEYLEGLGVPVAKKKPAVVPADWKKARLLLTVMANPHNDMAVHQFLIAEKGKSAADVYRRDAAKAMVSLYDHVREHLFAGKIVGLGNLQLQCLSHESRERIHDACRQLPVGWTVQDLILFLSSGEAEAQQIGTGVYVGTVHSAKGKEWDQVFLCGVEHPWYPGRDSLAESRRLLYVGLTRGRRRVVLTWVKARPQWRGANVKPGPMEDRVPSQFLFEMGL
jgi:superfamily I DNA/RNA helicase